MSAELKDNIIFFKNKPSRLWSPEDGGYPADAESSGCLTYNEMNNNLNTLEGRAIKEVRYDDNCNVVIELLNGMEFSTGAPCSESQCVLNEDLNYGDMFKYGGCSYNNGNPHFGWLTSNGSGMPDAYNRNTNDTFPAGTTIESVLRQILVSGGAIVRNVVLTGSIPFEYNEQREYSGDVSLSGGGYNGRCTVSFRTNVDTKVQKTTGNFSSDGEYNDITITSLQLPTVENVNFYANVTVTVKAKESGTVDARYVFALSGLESSFYADCDWNYDGPVEGFSYPLIFKLENTLDNINRIYSTEHRVNPVTSANCSSYEAFVSGGKNVYYFFSEIPASNDYSEEKDKTYVGVLRLPLSTSWNRMIQCFDNSSGEWVNVDNINFLEGANKPENTCGGETSEYDYYYFNVPYGKDGYCFAINIIV